MVWGHSPTLALDLCCTEGRLWFYDPSSGQWLGNVLEQLAGRLAAEAEVARLQAELQRLRGEIE